MSTTARLASYLDPSAEHTARWLTTPCRLSDWTVQILIHQSGLLGPAGQNQMWVAPPPINSGSDSRRFGGPWSSDERGRSLLINTAVHARGANSGHTASIARGPTALPPKQTIICVPASVKDMFAIMSEKVCEVKVTNVSCVFIFINFTHPHTHTYARTYTHVHANKHAQLGTHLLEPGWAHN